MGAMGLSPDSSAPLLLCSPSAPLPTWVEFHK
jgi:hypothetical protein